MNALEFMNLFRKMVVNEEETQIFIELADGTQLEVSDVYGDPDDGELVICAKG